MKQKTTIFKRGFPIVIFLIILCLNIILIYKIYNKINEGKNNKEYTQTMENFSKDSSDKVNNDKEKHIAISFDDGPDPIHTPKLLDGLKERGVVATFFLLGKNIEGNEEIVKRMVDEGHSIGNHTYDHVDLTSISLKEAITQVEKENDLIYEITGSYPVLIRPPFGNYNKKIMNEIDMILAMWTVDPKDSITDKSAGQLTDYIIRNTNENDIILLHDIFEPSVEAALQTIDRLLDEGYTFINLEEMILD